MNSAPPPLNATQGSSPCWFVGAMVDGRIAAQVRSMGIGKRFEQISEAG
ncbi:MAG: hypothetical protein VKM34_05445 [Cyanobacteriota bacterium]|nr:hypothetical protein [Cyanobacteriota bacterium]